MRSSAAVSGTLAVDVAFEPSAGQVTLAVAARVAQVKPGAPTVPEAPPPHDPCQSGIQLPIGTIEFGNPAAPGEASSQAPPDPATLRVEAGATSAGQPVAVAFAPGGSLVQQTRLPLALVWSDRALVLDAQWRTVDSGDILFHLDSGGGIACASCHPEGGDDGRVWRFAGLGSRRTMSLRGGLLGAGPFHWSGSLPTFPALVDEVFVRRMGGPQPSAGQTAALKRYLDAMPSPAPPPPGNTASVERGRALFASSETGCAICHAGERRSNGAIVDVGTGTGALKVPVLRDLASHAPYMHNGCAPTLADRFGPCGGDHHGATSQLSPDQIHDLTSFLATL